METKNEENNMGNDFVDSSLFFEKETESPIEKNETIVSKVEAVEEKESPVEELLNKSTDMIKPLPEAERRVNEDDILIIKADKDDSKNYSKWLFFLIILFVIGALAGGAYWLLNNKKSESVVVNPTEDVAEKENDLSQESISKEEENVEAIVQSDESLIEINPLEVNISVLNGSGVAGAAGKIKDFLVSKKYENVETGNYSSVKESGLIIYYKEEIFKENAQQLKDILKDEKVEIQLMLASKEEEKVSDIVIVVGK